MSTPSRTARPNLEAEIGLLNWGAAHHAEIQMRYSDADMMGHLNNAVYAEYLEVSRSKLMKDLKITPEDNNNVVVRLELEYRREIRLGQQVVAQSLIEELGRTSWVTLTRLLADGVPSAFARTVIVKVGPDMRPAPLTETTRTQLQTVLAHITQAQPEQPQTEQA